MVPAGSKDGGKKRGGENTETELEEAGTHKKKGSWKKRDGDGGGVSKMSRTGGGGYTQ